MSCVVTNCAIFRQLVGQAKTRLLSPRSQVQRGPIALKVCQNIIKDKYILKQVMKIILNSVILDITCFVLEIKLNLIQKHNRPFH